MMRMHSSRSGIGYIQQDVPFRHPDNDEALLAVVLPIIQALDGERIFKTVFASSKLTPWLCQLASALASCHSNCNPDHTTEFPF